MKKKVIVACGGAVATSTIAAGRIREICREKGMDIEICQVRISEIASNTEGAALLVTTSRIKRDYGIPYVNGMAFVSGIGEEETAGKILEILKN